MSWLLVLALLAQPHPAGPIVSSATNQGPAFAFAPPSGTGLPVAQSLCDALTPAELTGGWCLRGDGTMQPGSAITMVVTGTVTPAARTVCPSGPDCAQMTLSPVGAGGLNYYRSSTALTVSGDFTVLACALPETLVSSVLVGGDGFATSFYLGPDALNVQNSPLPPVTGPILHAPALLAGTRVGSTVTAYVNGTQTGTIGGNSTAAFTTRIGVGCYEGGTACALHSSCGAAMVQSGLSGARIAQLARAVLADAPTGARGEALTVTRASPRFCESSNGSGSYLPNNRACVARGALHVANGATNLLLRYDAPDNAIWGGTATVSANDRVGPGGLLQADTITDSSGVAIQGRTQTVTTSTLSRYTFDCRIQAGTATSAQLTITGVGNAAGNTTCDFTTIPASPLWGPRLVCTSPAAFGAGLTGVTVAVNVGTTTGVTGTLGFGWCELVAQAWPSTEARTEGAAVATAQDLPSLAATGLSTANGCGAYTLTPEWNGADFTPASTAWGLALVNTSNLIAGHGNGLNARSSDGTTNNDIVPSPAFARLVPKRIRTTWTTGGNYVLTDGTATGTVAFDGTMGSGTTPVLLGGATGVSSVDGYISDVQLDPNPLRCR